LNEIAAIQRQLRHLLRGDDLAERWIGCLDSNGITGNGNRSDYRGGNQRKIEFAGFVDLEIKSLDSAL
jgi:hypothetical protein